MLTEIDPLDFLVVAQLPRCSGTEDRTIVDDIGAVGYLQSLADVVVGNENADLLGLEVLDEFLDLKNRDRINS